MNRYYLVKTNNDLKLGEVIKNCQIYQNDKLEVIEITDEINENGLTQNGFLTQIIDDFKVNNAQHLQKLTKQDKLAIALEDINGASLWDGANTDDYIELRNYDNENIIKVKKIIKKCGFFVVSERMPEGSDYESYVIFIKEKK